MKQKIKEQTKRFHSKFAKHIKSPDRTSALDRVHISDRRATLLVAAIAKPKLEILRILHVQHV
jgi:hypothetical protein